MEELKEFLRIDTSDTSQDNTISTLAVAGRSWCEVYCKRKFVKQSCLLMFDFFPGYIDLKLTGAKVSSPFVSGSNAVLVGIRYAIELPQPPVFSVDTFVYLNANGQTTSMITGPVNIASVSNVLGNNVVIVTAQPHGLATGSTATLVGNAALLVVFGGQASQAMTVVDPYTLIPTGILGTGTTISATGTLTGYNYVQDIQSNPARLSPIFGQMWPVARVQMNAVQVGYTVGYAVPITVTTTANTATITSPYTFQSTDVGCPISIPEAGQTSVWGSATLNTIVQSVSGGVATLRDTPATAVSSQVSLLVNNPNCQPSHWELIRAAIKFYVNEKYEGRLPDAVIFSTIQDLLGPVRDKRF